MVDELVYKTVALMAV
jgi:hypothetical protein